jgi:predicted phage tail protein
VSQLRTIRLYGKLGAKFGRVHRFAVNSAAEAVRAMCSQFPGFETYLVESKQRNEGYAVFYGKKNLVKDELHYPAGNDDIRIAPALFGSKKGGVLNLIVGFVLVVIGVILLFTPFAPVGTVFIQMGVGMMIGGVIQMLMPGPNMGGMGAFERSKNKPSYHFNGPVNTEAQGHPVPLLYGRMTTGSAVISAGIMTEDIYVPQPASESDLWKKVFTKLFHMDD